MSFGAARSRALCTIRLSPGNTLTVQAGPRIRRWGAVTFRIAVHIVYRRFIRSEIMGVSNSRNPATNAGSGRPIWRRIRNPGPGFNSDVIGLLTMAPTSRRPPRPGALPRSEPRATLAFDGYLAAWGPWEGTG